MLNAAYVYWIFLLFGYLFLNKSFAYWGFPPLYVSELGLGLAGAACIDLARKGRGGWGNFKPGAIYVLLLFLAWQAICTIPFLVAYKLMAVRDAMLWIYAAYALFMLFTFTPQMSSRYLEIYSKIAPFLVAWWVIVFILHLINASYYLYPLVLPLPFLKPGDVGVHLAGIAAWFILGLDRSYEEKPFMSIMAFWLCWWVAWLFYGAMNRAGMISAVIGLIVVLMFRPRRNWLPVIVAGFTVFVVFYVTDVHISLGSRKKEVSVVQMVDNVRSAFSAIPRVLLPNVPPSPTPNLNVQPSSPAPTFAPQSTTPVVTSPPAPGGEYQDLYRGDTIAWRVGWWKDIVSYTIKGKYFWMGRGYGINLAIVTDVSRDNDNLRNPHNATMTFLARSGVPGVILWLIFLAALAAGLWRIVFLKITDSRTSNLAVWMLAYLAAFLFNSSFDVFLEGPMGGIWFWSLVGLALLHIANTSHHRAVDSNSAQDAGGAN